LVVDGNELSYGQVLEQTHAHQTWNACVDSYDYQAQKERVKEFNTSNSRYKKG